MLRTFGYTALFLGEHYQARYSPLAVHILLQRPLRAPLKSHFTRSRQSHAAEELKKQNKQKKTRGKCQWGDAVRVAEVRVRCAGGKQSVGPALKPCVSAVAAAGSIAPAFWCCHCTLRLQSTHYNINCVIRFQCLP